MLNKLICTWFSKYAELKLSVRGYYIKTRIFNKFCATYFEDRQHIFIYACCRKNTSRLLHQILRWWKLLSQLWTFKIWYRISLLKIPKKMKRFKKNLELLLLRTSNYVTSFQVIYWKMHDSDKIEYLNKTFDVDRKQQD